jgi:Domain of unknown function (DUF4340)
MRAKGAALQGGLAAIGLLAAYATWQREPERAPGEVVVVDAGKADLTMVRYDEDKRFTEITQSREGGDAVAWLKVSANEQAKTPERVLRGNDGAIKLWDKLTPLRATRALGKLGADKLKEFGLDAPKKKITLTGRFGSRVLDVGTSPFGVSDPYVKDAASGEVYVLGGGVVSDLESAGVRLVDRTMHGFKPSEYDGLMVSAGGKKRELVQTGGAAPATAKLASKKTPTKPDEMAKNWHDKVWRMFPIDLLGKDEQPKNGVPLEALRIDYTSKGAPKGWIVIGRVAVATPPPPANASQPPPPAATSEYFARTERTAGWVRVPPNTEELLKEAEKIAAAE